MPKKKSDTFKTCTSLSCPERTGGKCNAYVKEFEIKEKIQMFADDLFDLCIDNTEDYHNYSDTDLFHATHIFSHFLMDKIYSENIDLSLKAKEDLAEAVGKAIRELILASTGKDMYEVVKKLMKE